MQSSVTDLANILGTQRNLAIDWFTDNKMIVYLHKFQAIILKPDPHLPKKFVLFASMKNDENAKKLMKN